MSKKNRNRVQNAQHAAIRTSLFKQQVVKPKRGKGSYSRKGRGGQGQPKAA